MIGLVLVTHAGLAEELLRAAEMIVGVIELTETVAIRSDDPVDGIRDAIAGAVGRVDTHGVIIMTDMLGGTPSNISLSFLKENRVEVLTGVNLPMVITFASERESAEIFEFARRLKASAQESILVAGEYLK